MNIELFQTSNYGLVSMNSTQISQCLFKLTDVDNFLKWASDDKVTRYLRWDTITSREEALTYLEKVAIPILGVGPYVWMIVQLATC